MKNYSDRSYTLEQCKQEFINDLKEVGKRREGMDNLIEYLEKKSDFFQAPACARGPESCEGGLLRHSLNVMARMVRDIGEDRMSTGQGETNQKLLDSIMIVSHLSGIWKANYFRPIIRKTEDEKGNAVEYVSSYRPKPPEERLCYGKDNDHGDEAVYILQGYISLSRSEALAIRSQDWNPRSEEASRIFNKNPLALFLHTADLKARYLDEIQGAS